MEQTDNFLYTLKYDNQSVVVFKDLMPNLDYLHILMPIQIHKLFKPLVDKIKKNLGIEDNPNSFFPYLPALFFLNYHYQQSATISFAQKLNLQKCAKELYELINLDTYPSLVSFHYPYLQIKKNGFVSGSYRKKEIESYSQSFIDNMSVLQNIEKKLNEYEAILIKNNVNLEARVDLLESHALGLNLEEKEKEKFYLSPQEVLSKNRVSQALYFSHIKTPQELLSLCVDPREENNKALLQSLLSPPGNYWSLLCYRSEHKSHYVSDPIVYVEQYNSERLSFIKTHDATKAYRGSWEEICAMVKNERKKDFLALYFENHKLVKTQAFSDSLEPTLNVFKEKIDSLLVKNKLSQQIAETKEKNFKNKFKV